MPSEDFIRLFAEKVLKGGQFAQMYEQFAAMIPENKVSDKHFCEVLFLSLFIDCLCLEWAFGAETAANSRDMYIKHFISEVGKSKPGTYEGEFKAIMGKRCTEYKQIVCEINPINIDTRKALDSLTRLGEAFSKHFVGHENLETILKVKWFFLMKEDILYEKFLKGIKENHELSI